MAGELTTLGLARGYGIVDYMAWIIRDQAGNAAAFQLDAANDRGYFKGAIYPTETAFLAATGGSKSGVARTFGGLVKSGSTNFITNPGPFANTTGWAANSGASLAAVGGELEMTSGGSLNVASQPINAGSIGKAVRLRATCRRGTSVNSYNIGVGINPNFGNGQLSPSIASTVASDYTTYAAPSSGNYICFRNQSGAGTGTAYSNAWLCEECLPFDGWVHETSTIVIKATTPATISSTQALLSLDVWDGVGSAYERERIRIQQASDGTVSLIMTVSASAVFTQSFGVIAPSTSFTIAVAWAGTAMKVSINGGVVASKASGSGAPGAAFMRLGRSPTGETWTGTIENVAYFPTQQPDDWLVAASAGFGSNVIYAEGDSYMAGAGGVALSSDIRTLTGRPVASSAVGGSTLQQVYDRLVARPYERGKPLVIWDGSGNSYGSVAATLAIIDQIIALHGDASKIIVVPTVSVGPSADGVVTAYTLDMEAIRDGLIVRGLWPAGAAYDPTTQINTLTTGTVQDLKDVAARVVAQSQLQDSVHLLQTPMSKVSALVQAVISARGI